MELRIVPDLAPDPPVAAARPGPPSDAVYREGLTSARRELRAGTARRHRGATLERSSDPGSPTAGAVAAIGNDELRTQRAGVRAALAELRQHRGTA